MTKPQFEIQAIMTLRNIGLITSKINLDNFISLQLTMINVATSHLTIMYRSLADDFSSGHAFNIFCVSRPHKSKHTLHLEDGIAGTVTVDKSVILF